MYVQLNHKDSQEIKWYKCISWEYINNKAPGYEYLPLMQEKFKWYETPVIC